MLIEQSPKDGRCWGPLTIMILERFTEVMRERCSGQYYPNGIGEAITELKYINRS